MKLLIEDYQYNAKDVGHVLDGLFTLQDIDQKISVNYVGYYYNPIVKDCVFILPKVLIDAQGKVFEQYDPASLIDLDTAKLNREEERKFLYEFAVWIHRALVVYNDSHAHNGIVLHRQIENQGNGTKKKSNTLLDVILSLIRFNKENKAFFTYILKNIHSGYNKINWGKTVTKSTAMVDNDQIIYLNPVNKKRQINFDEELFIIFFSILNYVSETYGFRSDIPFGFKLIKGSQFERYLNGYGKRRLTQIKYKYFSDISLKLWGLCYAFFEKTYQLRMSAHESEYLIAKSFHIVFEAIIEDLIGDNDVPAGLKEQEDGKLVDHFYTYQGLVSNREENNDVYYIGDSKYYKIGNEIGKESIYKQYTYARNVIQWNLNLFLDPEKQKGEKDKYRTIKLRDDITEGYNIIPNFFISADINPKTLSYEDTTKEHSKQPPISRHFANRLYDRDTLLLSHYDVNFLFVLSLYAQNKASAKDAYKHSVRRKFRESIQKLLNKHFDFYAIQPHPGVNSELYFKTHFRDVTGKIFSPYHEDEVFSLALDKIDANNSALLDTLKKDFYVCECRLGEEPRKIISEEVIRVGHLPFSGIAEGSKFITCYIRPKYSEENENSRTPDLYDRFMRNEAEGLTYYKNEMPSGPINEVNYLLPIINNSIVGFYEIQKLSFGERTKVFGEQSIKLPILKIQIGKFHPFNLTYRNVANPRMSNQIWSIDQLNNLLNKANTATNEPIERV